MDPRAGFAAWLLVVLVPSSNLLWFSGLPLATWPEWVAVALLVPIAFSKRLARRLVDDSPRRWLTTRRLTSAALLALGLKFLVAMTTSHVGFAACYTSPMAAPVRGRCETTFSYPFSDGRYTRYEATIDRRGPGWQLAFLNHLRLIPADAEAPARDLEAFTVEYSGRLRADEALVVRVAYSGTAEATIGTITRSEPASTTSPAAFEFPLARGEHDLRLIYHSAPGKEPHLALLRVDAHGATVPLQVVAPPRRATVALRLFDSLTAFVVASVAVATLRALALPMPVFAWLSFVVAVLLGTEATQEAWLYPLRNHILTATGLLALTLLRGPGWRTSWRAWTIGASLGALWAIAMFRGNVDGVWLRSIGNDPLTYESFARDILSGWSVQGGEDVFYYQPLFRYWRFVERVVFGDGEALLIASAFGLLCASFMAFFAVAFRSAIGKGRSPLTVATILVAAVLTLLLATTSLPMIGWPASEYPTWILLPLSTLLFVTGRTASNAMAAASVAASIITRVNQAPGQAWLLVSSLLARRRPAKTRAAVVATLLAIVLLPLAHNMWFGGRAVPFTTSAGIPQNLNLPPSRLLDDWNSSLTRTLLAQQIDALLYRLEDINRTPLQAAAFHGLLGVWIVVCCAGLVRVVRHRDRPAIIGMLSLATPAAFLSVHVFYQVTTYYPRHIVAGYLAMGIAVIQWSMSPTHGRRLPPTGNVGNLPVRGPDGQPRERRRWR
jgi:hypothetical protein